MNRFFISRSTRKRGKVKGPGDLYEPAMPWSELVVGGIYEGHDGSRRRIVYVGPGSDSLLAPDVVLFRDVTWPEKLADIRCVIWAFAEWAVKRVENKKETQDG